MTGAAAGSLFFRWRRQKQHIPTTSATRTIAPPTAIPAIAPVGSGLDECEFVGVGIALVGVLETAAACCPK